MLRAGSAACATAGLAALVASCAPAPALRPRLALAGVATLTVTSFNVDVHRAGDAATLEAVGAVDADVVCLQETGPRWEKALRDRWSRRYPYMRFRNHRQWSGGLAVLSKQPIESLAYVRAPDGTHPAWRLRVQTPLGPVQIVEVHLRPMLDRHEGFLQALATVDHAHRAELDRFMAGVRDDLPTIVLGDFNEGPNGAAVRYLANMGFRSLLPLFHPGATTWRHPIGPFEIGATLDHVVVDRHFVPLDARVVRVGRSDHLPVAAVLVLRASVPGLAEHDARR